MPAMLVASALLCACSAKIAPDCARQPETAKLDGAEKAALADALARYAERCRLQDRQCDISLARNGRKDIVVTITSTYPDKDGGRCLQAPGDQELAVYRPDGTFIRRVMSL